MVNPGLAAFLALALAALALACLPYAALGGAALFTAAGAVLAWAMGRRRDAWPRLLGQPRAPLRRPELLGLLLVLALASAVRFYRLDLYPPGPAFVESTLGIDTANLDQAPYTPHLTDKQAEFPSMLCYQGLASARLLGWTERSFRLIPALWGTLSVAAFYVLLRQLCGPLAALLFSALFSANVLHLSQSRLYFPGSLLFFSLCAAAALSLQALRNGRSWAWAGLGLACGLGLHGYLPGRSIPPFFAAWLALTYAWLPPRQRPRKALLFLAAGTALVLASPVLLWGLRHPEHYWHLVQHNRSTSLEGFWGALTAALPRYAAFFHLQGDSVPQTTDGLALYPLLRPDWLTQALFPLGLLVCLARWKHPLSWLVLGGFVMGLAPALFSANYPPPNTRRALMVLPWAYVAAALAWEGVRALLSAPGLGRAWSVAWVWLSLGLGAWALHASAREYFVEIMGRPGLRSNFNQAGGLALREARLRTDHEVKASLELLEPGTTALVFYTDRSHRIPVSAYNFLLSRWPPGQRVRAYRHFEDFLVFDSVSPQLLLMQPSLSVAAPLLKALFPQGQARLFEDAPDTAIASSLRDPYMPDAYLFSFAIQAVDLSAFQGLVDLNGAPGHSPRLAAWDEGFAKAQAGRSLRLGGVLVLQSEDPALEWGLDWPGWELWVDEEPVSPGRVLALSPGPHRLRLQGQVPLSARGPLPLRLADGDRDCLAQGALLPLDPRLGLHSMLRGAKGKAWSRHEVLPYHRFSGPDGPEAPFQARWTGRWKPREPGRYALRLRPPMPGRVTLGPAGALTIEAEIQGRQDAPETALLEMEREGEPGWRPVPFDWVWAP